MAKPRKRAFDSQMEPWRDWSELDEREAINRLQELADKARRAGAHQLGRVAVIGVANYTLQTSKDWPDLLTLASTLEREFGGGTSPRIGR